MEQNHPPESQNQNIIEAIGMEPEVFQDISEDVKSNIFTSPRYLQDKHDLSEIEADAVLLELQNQGFVTKDHVKGSYGVFPEGIQSRELTKRRKLLTSRLGRSVLLPTIQTLGQTKSVTTERVSDAARFVTGGPIRDSRKQLRQLHSSQKEQDREWQESYQEKVKGTQQINKEHLVSQQDIEDEITRQIKEELLTSNDTFTVVNSRVRARFANVKPQNNIEEPSHSAESKDDKPVTPAPSPTAKAAPTARPEGPSGHSSLSERLAAARQAPLEQKAPEAQAKQTQPDKAPEQIEQAALLREIDHKIGIKIADYLRNSSDHVSDEQQIEDKRAIREQVVAEYLGPGEATEEQISSVLRQIRALRDS